MFSMSGGQCGPHPGLHLANLPSWASIPNQSAAEGGDGALSPHLHAGISQFRLNRACSGHVDAPNREALQRRGSATYLHHSLTKGAGKSLFTQSSRDIFDLLNYEPIYCHTIPLRAEKVDRVSLPSLRIEGRAPRLDAFSSEEVEEDSAQLVLNRSGGWVIPGSEPSLTISISILDKDHLGDVAHTPPRFVGEVEISPFREISYSGGSSGKADMMRFSSLRKRTTPSADLPFVIAPPTSQVSEERNLWRIPPRGPRGGQGKTSSRASRELWKLEFSACELGRQLMVAHFSKDYDTSMALARVVLLLIDVASLNEESPNAFQDLLVMQATVLANRMQEQSIELKKAKKKVTEFHFEAYLDGWTTCLDKLGIPEDSPAWAKAAPTLGYLESPAPYSPLILPSFDELEYRKATMD
ncbi:hypothetical protein Acr_00g0055880 [Actinidia rufa]|uniref:Uncharacterized protein n=1 Tax=Actinidia rufa TaxID=165716 RepID=A0A7J0DMM5_9ERIC|nr:hypothetical protein Acr_00g0055880 [Actinidia rufa]